MTQPIATARIALQAFALMEMDPPASWGDGSPQVAQTAALYPEALEQCLRAADWSFAARLYDLPGAIPDVTDPDLPVTAHLPPEALAVRRVGAPRDRWHWRVEGRLLRTDHPAPVRIRATVRIDREEDLPADFRLAVAARLAAALSPRFASSANRAARLEDLAQLHLAAALQADRREASPHRYDGAPHQPDWASSVIL